MSLSYYQLYSNQFMNDEIPTGIITQAQPLPILKVFSNPICKQTYDSLPKIYGSKKKQKIIIPGKHLLINQRNLLKKNQKSLEIQKQRQSSPRHHSKCSKEKIINRNYSITPGCQGAMRKSSKNLLHHKKKFGVLPEIRSFELDDLQSNHKVVMNRYDSFNQTGLQKIINQNKNQKETKTNKFYDKFKAKINTRFEFQSGNQTDHEESKQERSKKASPKFKTQLNETESNKSKEQSSLSSYILKGLKKQNTNFYELNKTLAQPQKRNNLQLSNGLFRIPQAPQFQEYINDYEPLNPKFDMQKLKKSPNFSIIKEEKGVYFGEVDREEKKSGEGVTVSEKQIYQGRYKANIKIQGYQRNIDGVYIGGYLNSERSGFGIFKWNNGEVYEGMWKNGVKEGQGLWRSSTGDWCQGQWKRNRQNGKGTFKHKNSTYVGNFLNSLKHGQGEENFSNGDKYIGAYKEGKPNGKGKYIWKYGGIYEGEFVNGMREGKGIWSDVDGTIYEAQAPSKRILSMGLVEKQLGLEKCSWVSIRWGRGFRVVQQKRKALTSLWIDYEIFLSWNEIQNNIYLMMWKIIFFVWVATCFTDFGMNKPHHLFHIGDRKSISNNIGWGYWVDSHPPRLKYQNQNDGVYASMQLHDGSKCFHETVTDTKNQVESQIKFQVGEEDWQTHISMQNLNNHSDTNWFAYFSVENNDYRFVDHEKYTTFISLTPSSQSQNHFTIHSERIGGIHQDYHVHSNQKLKIFGLTANISETYNIEQISGEFAHLIELTKDPTKDRKRQQKIRNWENAQLELIKDNKWQGKKFVVVFVYGKLSETSQVFITNSTAKTFDKNQFQRKKHQIEETYHNQQIDKSMLKLMKHSIYNLYGGLTFYFGRLYTQNSLLIHRQDFSYTFTPSRLIFPRSFLWDDGFHQMVVVKYNPKIVIEMLEGWVRKIDTFGWIGREQIRGYEMSAMMPDSTYIFQDWFEMNPPTLMLPILYLIQNKDQFSNDIRQQTNGFIMNNYKKLQQWYRYLKSTQSHQSLQYPETLNNTIFYRWQCKDDCKKGNFMGSGLDDYPRRQNDTELAKQHVDIVSWLYFFSDSLATIAKGINSQIPMKKQINYYEKESQALKDQLYKNFLDRQDYLFKDVVVVDASAYAEKFVNKIGYINLFPFFTGMLRDHSVDSDRIRSLRQSLRIMMDEKLLLAEDGLRSLSFSDQLYGTDENYWRGAVWLPINYLVLRACKLYYWEDKPIQEEVRSLYRSLRQRLMDTISKNYEQTGYLYENYYEGKGHRGFPFYGWTALIANIISQTY